MNVTYYLTIDKVLVHFGSEVRKVSYSMTADQYQVQVLERVLFDYYWQKSEEKGQVVFQQDGAPSHRAKSTTAWLNRNHLEVFPHPANSPDLSPIEPLWHQLKVII